MRDVARQVAAAGMKVVRWVLRVQLELRALGSLWHRRGVDWAVHTGGLCPLQCTFRTMLPALGLPPAALPAYEAPETQQGM